MKLEDVKVGMRIFYDRFPGTDVPMPGVIDELTAHNKTIYAWVTCIGERYLAPLGKLLPDLKHESVIAVVLKVNHLEAIADGFEEGDPLSLVWFNPLMFEGVEKIPEFLKPINLLLGYADGCWDYAVYKTEPEGITVNVGPGDQFVVYADGSFGAYVGAGQLKVIDNVLCVVR